LRWEFPELFQSNLLTEQIKDAVNSEQALLCVEGIKLD